MRLAIASLLCLHTFSGQAISQGADYTPSDSGRLVRRDWTRYPAIVQLDVKTEIFAIGDIHGDAERLRNLLIGSGIVRRPANESDSPAWIASRAILVFTGDLIDKGPDAVGVIRFIRSLQEQAGREGGQVVVLMGNHEAEFLANPHAEKAKDFSGQLERARMDPAGVARCEGEVGRFLCNLPFGARINDWFFSHAGNTGGRSMKELIHDLERGVDEEGFGTSQLTDENSILEARLGEKGAAHPWIESRLPHTTPDALLEEYSHALGVSHIVEGHQHGEFRFADGSLRSKGEVFQWRGALFLIDTGMSRDIDDSTGAILHIRDETASAICADGSSTTIWGKNSTKPFGRAKPCGMNR